MQTAAIKPGIGEHKKRDPGQSLRHAPPRTSHSKQHHAWVYFSCMLRILTANSTDSFLYSLHFRAGISVETPTFNKNHVPHLEDETVIWWSFFLSFNSQVNSNGSTWVFYDNSMLTLDTATCVLTYLKYTTILCFVDIIH